jgi:hypothetical protein
MYAPSADAQGGLTAVGARTDIRFILNSVLAIQKDLERMVARSI